MLAHGFARVRCESCKDERLVAFSCNGRGLCPSYNAKRAGDSGALGGAGATSRALPSVDAVLAASGAVSAAQERGTALGDPHRLPARSVGLERSRGTTVGSAGWAGRGSIVRSARGLLECRLKATPTHQP